MEGKVFHVITFEKIIKYYTTVIKGMLNNVSKFLSSDEELLDSLVRRTRANCPFCQESVKEKTPMFTQDFLKEGMIFIGDAVVMPNLLGHAERSVLVVVERTSFGS